MIFTKHTKLLLFGFLIIISFNGANLSSNSLLGIGFIKNNIADPYIKILDTSVNTLWPFDFKISGHSDSVNSLELISNTIMASGSTDHDIKIWNYTTQLLIRSIDTGHAVLSLLLLPNGLLAAGNDDKHIRIYDINSGTRLVDEKSHGGNVNALESIGNNRFVSGSEDHKIFIWSTSASSPWINFVNDIDTGKFIISLKYIQNLNLACGFSDSNDIEVYDIPSRGWSFTLSGHSGPVRALEHLNNGDLASGSEDNLIKIWDLSAKVLKYNLVGHTGNVYALKALENGFLSSGSEDMHLKLWNVTNASVYFDQVFNREIKALELFSFENLTIINITTTTSTSTTTDSTTTTTATTTTTTLPSIIYTLNSSFSFGQLSTTQTIQLLNSNYDLSGCIVNCSNNGICSYNAGSNNFYCSCAGYYTGQACQFDSRPCSSNPCLNNATCIDYTNSVSYNMTSIISSSNSSEFYCSCSQYYTGAYCENKIDICQNETCSGNGNCIDKKSIPICECFALYQGDKCEIQSSELKTIKTIVAFTSIIAIITVVSFYCCIVLLDISKYFMKNKEHGNKHQVHSITKYVYVNWSK